ncbi:MAG TPA: MoxR family ATPase [Bacillota bacterium]|nr:MoxR family ATPase [Bacillota bacterium]
MNALEDMLPITIQQLLRSHRGVNASEFEYLIGKGGYIPPNTDLLTDAVTALAMGKNILLKGPTGAGKTKFAESLSLLFHKPMHMVNCSVDLDAESLLGWKSLEYKENKQHITFIPGPVIKAMKNGHFLYIDEVNMAKPETLPLINGVLDYRRMITNPFTAEVIKASEGFGVIAAINEGYIGTIPLNEALKNRFVVFEVPYIEGEPLRSLIKDYTKLQDETLITLFVRLSTDLILAASQGKVSEDAASIRALLDACDLSTMIPPIRAIKRSIIDKLEEEKEREFIQGLTETLF